MPNRKCTESMLKAKQALDNDALEEARLACERAIEQDPGCAEAFSIYGVVLAREGKYDPAVEAFRKALMLAPTDPRHAYNLAAHAYAKANYRMARDIVVESLKDDPNFEPAKQLLDRIDENQHDGVVEFVVPDVQHPQIEVAEGDIPHLMPFMRGMEKQWTTAGWVFVGLAALTAVCYFVFQPFVIPTSPPTNGKAAPYNFKGDIASVITVFLMVVSGIFTIMWVLIDVIDRRMRLVWLVPSIVCCAVGLHALPHALYMLMRRQ